MWVVLHVSEIPQDQWVNRNPNDKKRRKGEGGSNPQFPAVLNMGL